LEEEGEIRHAIPQRTEEYVDVQECGRKGRKGEW